MKFIVAILLFTLSATQAATYPSAAEIAADFKKTNDYYTQEATKFVAYLATELDARALKYAAAHQKLVTHYASVRLVPGVLVDANGEAILAKISAKIQDLITSYGKVLDRNIFSNELNKHMDKLKEGYLNQAEDLIEELAKYVTSKPEIGKCWQESRDEIYRIVNTALLAARDAAITTVQNANITLNTNEVLIDALVSADNGYINICKSLGTAGINSCISGFLTAAEMTFPISSSIWELTTSSTVSNNLKVAESLIQSATQISIIQVTQLAYTIENCVKNVLTQPKN